MLKPTLKIVALATVIVAGYPVVHYREVAPCEMLRKELRWQMDARIESAAASAKATVESLGIESSDVEHEVKTALEGVAGDISAGVADAKVRRMSSRACVAELWRITIGGDDAYEGTP